MYNTTYHLKGIEILGGKLNLNNGYIEGANCICIGDWSIEIGSEGDLVIKHDDILQAKITNNNLSHVNDVKYDRFFMIDPINIEDSKGLLVSNIGKFYNYDMSQSPTLNECQSVIKLSRKIEDPSLIGVITDCEKYSREFTNGAFKTVCSQDDEVNRVYINNKGIGVVWVCDINDTLCNGDYITTSFIPGYGMRQNTNIKYNYTFAKITHDCNFNPKTIQLEKPIDFDEDGPIYEAVRNSEGEVITDLEYQVKYVNKDGIKCKRKDFEKDIERIMLKEKKERKDILKSNDRKIFQCALVAFIIN